jgi:hypothetical protein
MWFKFPADTAAVSIQLQNFISEATDPEGNGYFRAPNHFASEILNLKGFSASEPPSGSPDDLPPENPLKDQALAKLSKEVESLRSDLAVARAERDAAQNELKGLQDLLLKAQAEIEKLEEELDEAPQVKTLLPSKKA